MKHVQRTSMMMYNQIIYCIIFDSPSLFSCIYNSSYGSGTVVRMLRSNVFRLLFSDDVFPSQSNILYKFVIVQILKYK